MAQQVRCLWRWGDTLDQQLGQRGSRFTHPNWNAVARWLHAHAGCSSAELLAGLEGFGNTALLKPVVRDQDHTPGKGLAGYEQLVELLKSAADETPPELQQRRIELLAERLAGLTDPKEAQR